MTKIQQTPLTRLTLTAAVLIAAFTGTARSDENRDRCARDGKGGPVGSYRVTVTVTSPPGLPPLEGFMTFVPGGGLIEARRLYVADFPSGPVIETPGHGGWVPSSRGHYDVAFQFLFQAGPGHPAAGQVLGTDEIRWRASIDQRTGRMEGPWKSQITDPAGNILFQAEGTIGARPFVVTPL